MKEQVFLFWISGCSIFEFGEYDSFGEWYIGPAGMIRTFNGSKSSEGLYCKRPWIYGHFRIPELVFQPAGWFRYPDRRTITNASLGDAMAAAAEAQNRARNSISGYGEASYMRVTVRTDGPEDSLAFDWFDAGLIEIIPFRVWTSEKGAGYKIGMTLLQSLNGCMMALMKGGVCHFSMQPMML